MARRRAKDIRNVVVISDTHSGCRLALCHPDGIRLDDGGDYMPSKLQRKLWDLWEEFWGEWVPRSTHKEPFAVVHNGDCLEGVHHGATTPWSHNLKDQADMAYKILRPVVEACEGRYYSIRGTEAHVGKSAAEAERLAARLCAVPNEEGQYSRWEMWLRLGGQLCHFGHHIGTTSSAQHETSALNAEIAAHYVDSCRWKLEPPTIVVRSHRHMSSEVRLPCYGTYCTVFVTAAWQLKTPFAYRTKAGRVNTPQVGGSLIRVGDEEMHTRHFVRPIQRAKEVVLG